MLQGQQTQQATLPQPARRRQRPGVAQPQPQNQNYFSRAGNYVRRNAKPIAIVAAAGLAALVLDNTIGPGISRNIADAAGNASSGIAYNLKHNSYIQLIVSGGFSGVASYYANEPNASGKSLADIVDSKIPAFTDPRTPPYHGPSPADSPRVPRPLLFGATVYGLTMFSGFPGNVPMGIGATLGYALGEAARNYRSK